MRRLLTLITVAAFCHCKHWTLGALMNSNCCFLVGAAIEYVLGLPQVSLQAGEVASVADMLPSKQAVKLLVMGNVTGAYSVACKATKTCNATTLPPTSSKIVTGCMTAPCGMMDMPCIQ